MVAVLLRNPWGYDERMAVGEFLQEWHRLSLGRLISMHGKGVLELPRSSK